MGQQILVRMRILCVCTLLLRPYSNLIFPAPACYQSPLLHRVAPEITNLFLLVPLFPGNSQLTVRKKLCAVLLFFPLFSACSYCVRSLLFKIEVGAPSSVVFKCFWKVGGNSLFVATAKVSFSHISSSAFPGSGKFRQYLWRNRPRGGRFRRPPRRYRFRHPRWFAFGQSSFSLFCFRKRPAAYQSLQPFIATAFLQK